ncbi:MAG: outer membrane protein transport protein [Isosphaeraceae bacterium]|nr:outer membrane protein transport protein [Isosphaeraceae bacterium]
MRTQLGLWAGCVILLTLISPARGQGLIAPSAGPINSAMAGASTAAPVDFGSSYWNPANISGLENQEFLLGTALTIPSIHLESSLKAGAVGGLFPPANRYGEARSDGGVLANLATGVAFRMADDSPVTYGIGIFGLAGGGVNFPGSTGTPILSPRLPNQYFGVGPIYSSMSLLAVAPMASVRLTDRLSFGGGPVITSGTVSFSPAFFAPGPKDGGLVATFPAATNAQPFWGGGFQLGLLYELEDWNFGFSYKSPVWQGRWDFNATYPNLAERRIGLHASLPAIYSWGVAYKALPKTLIDVDLRYFDYANSELFGQKVIDGGLDWRNVFAVATGAQYQATDRLTLRAGYLFNTNPIPDPKTLFNVQTPAIIQQTLTLGASLRLNDDVTLSLAWMHGFRDAIAGRILEVPGSSVRLDAQYDSIVLGLNVQFGAKRKQAASPVAETFGSGGLYEAEPIASAENAQPAPAAPDQPRAQQGAELAADRPLVQ